MAARSRPELSIYTGRSEHSTVGGATQGAHKDDATPHRRRQTSVKAIFFEAETTVVDSSSTSHRVKTPRESRRDPHRRHERDAFRSSRCRSRSRTRRRPVKEHWHSSTTLDAQLAASNAAYFELKEQSDATIFTLQTKVTKLAEVVGRKDEENSALTLKLLDRENRLSKSTANEKSANEQIKALQSERDSVKQKHANSQKSRGYMKQSLVAKERECKTKTSANVKLNAENAKLTQENQTLKAEIAKLTRRLAPMEDRAQAAELLVSEANKKIYRLKNSMVAGAEERAHRATQEALEVKALLRPTLAQEPSTPSKRGADSLQLENSSFSTKRPRIDGAALESDRVPQIDACMDVIAASELNGTAELVIAESKSRERQHIEEKGTSMQAYFSDYNARYKHFISGTEMMIARGGATGQWNLNIERATDEMMTLEVLDEVMHEDAIKKFFKPWHVKYTNPADGKGKNKLELGRDGGGLTNDLLGTVWKELLHIKVHVPGKSEKKLLFAGDATATWALPLEDGEVSIEAATIYEALGRLMSKAIISGANPEAATPTLIPDALFNPCFLHLCFNRGITQPGSNGMMSDEDVEHALKSIYPPGHFGLWSAKKLIENEATMDWASGDDADASTVVTYGSYHMYRRMCLERELKPRQKAFGHIMKGLLLHVDGENHACMSSLQFFSSKELSAMFCGKVGEPKHVLSALEFVNGNDRVPEGAIGHPGDSWVCDNMRKTKGWLLEFVSNLDAQGCEDFLSYCAGAVRVPARCGGEKADEMFKIHVVARGGSEPVNKLPFAQTCTRELSLGAYTSYDELKRAFRVAFKYAGGYFGDE